MFAGLPDVRVPPYAKAMRVLLPCALLLAPALAVWGQANRESGTVQYDVSGNRIYSGLDVRNVRTNGTAQQVRLRVGSNGREVPIDKIQEKVISEGPNGRVVERTVQLYDADGNPNPPQTIRVEETKRPDGGMTVRETVFQTDLNGRQELFERRTKEVRKQGTTTTTDLVTERPTLNASFDPVEKTTTVEREQNGRSTAETSVYRRGVSGQFVESARERRERTEQGGEVVENRTQYELGATGGFQAVNQVNSRVRKAADGSETEEIMVYTNSPAGRAGNDAPALKEQRIVERRNANGGTVESVFVREALPNDPNKLGPARKTEETVCKGTCGAGK